MFLLMPKDSQLTPVFAYIYVDKLENMSKTFVCFKICDNECQKRNKFE